MLKKSSSLCLRDSHLLPCIIQLLNCSTPCKAKSSTYTSTTGMFACNLQTAAAADRIMSYVPFDNS